MHIVEVHSQSERGAILRAGIGIDAAADLGALQREIDQRLHAHRFGDVEHGIEGLDTIINVEGLVMYTDVMWDGTNNALTWRSACLPASTNWTAPMLRFDSVNVITTMVPPVTWKDPATIGSPIGEWREGFIYLTLHYVKVPP